MKCWAQTGVFAVVTGGSDAAVCALSALTGDTEEKKKKGDRKQEKNSWMPRCFADIELELMDVASCDEVETRRKVSERRMQEFLCNNMLLASSLPHN